MKQEITLADKLQQTFNRLPQTKKDRINMILKNYEETVFSTPHEPNNEDRLVQEITTLREQVEKLKALVVMRCDLDVPPQFSQGLRPHEVLEPVTAEHCQWFVAEIEKLRKERETRLELAEQNKQLKAELKSIDGALNDPRANLTLTTSEIIWELKEQIERLTDAYDQCGRTVQYYGRTIDQTESRLREVATHCANVEQQLAAAPTPPVSEDQKDAELLDFLDRNLSKNIGWRVGLAPFGNIVLTSILNNKTSIREAIKKAMQEDKP